MRCSDRTAYVYNTVDIFNAKSGVWTTAALSVARLNPAATSLPNDGLAIFAGGLGASCVLISIIAGVSVWEGGGCVPGAKFAASVAAYYLNVAQL